MLKDGWKLVKLDVNKPETTRYELYNLSLDPDESVDLLEQYPSKVAALKKIMASARTENPIWNFTPDAP